MTRVRINQKERSKKKELGPRGLRVALRMRSESKRQPISRPPTRKTRKELSCRKIGSGISLTRFMHMLADRRACAGYKVPDNGNPPIIGLAAGYAGQSWDAFPYLASARYSVDKIAIFAGVTIVRGEFCFQQSD